VLKLTLPGVPDIYQGAELWDFSLVDPDNRRPVDYELRRQLLGKAQKASPSDGLASLLSSWPDGRIKLQLISRLLSFRRQRPDLFREGSYEPLTVEGAGADRVCAFARQLKSEAIVVVASLRPLQSSVTGSFADTTIAFPATIGDRNWCNIFDDTAVSLQDGTLSVEHLFAALPAAVLTLKAG
jgi:(1->4)-alpha-D-glucan 1-alpha-D-glucosylmutase